MEDQEVVEVLTPPVTPKATASSIDVRKHIEGISTIRDDKIRELVKSKHFDTLLGEIS